MEESRGNQLIPGQRFCPMEDELILFYLKPMLSGEIVLGRNRVVFECDLYGKQEPWEIWEEFKTKRPHDLRLNKDIYFFTQHKTISSTDKRIRRNVGSGTWRSDDVGKPVVSVETRRVVGSKKRLTYKNVGSVQNGCWILYEFFLDRSLRDKKQKVKDYVLCLLRKNGDPKTKIAKKRKQREEEEDVENNDSSDDAEVLTGEKEELLEPQAKKQRTAPSLESTPLKMPSPDDDVDAFAASLEETLECNIESDNAPSSEAEAIWFRGQENVGQQPLAADHGIFNPVPEEGFRFGEFLDKLSTEEMVGLLFYGTSSDIDAAEQNVVNSSTLVDAPTSSMSDAYDCCSTAMPYLSSANCCVDPSGSDGICGGVMEYEDGVCMPEPLVAEVPTATEEQQKTAADDNFPESWLGTIDFSPEANKFICSEMHFPSY